MVQLRRVIRFTVGGPVVQLYDIVTGSTLFEGTEEAAKQFISDTGDEIVETISEGASAIGAISLDFVRGLGGAIVEGLDGAYDAVRGKLEGKETDVIAGFTIATFSILAGVYIYHSVKAAKDAF